MGLFDDLRRRPAIEPSQPKQAPPETPPENLPAGDDREVLAAEIRRLRRLLETSAERAKVEALEDVAVSVASSLVHGTVQVQQLDLPGNSLGPEDLARSVTRIAAALDTAGVRLSGRIGEVQAYDSAHHTSTRPVTSGREVLVRVPGVVGPTGRVLRKAEVEPA